MRAGIYIHIPFCKEKCNYCDFYSVIKKGAGDFLSALETEIELIKKRYNLEAETIYIGGGTPTALNLEELDRLLELINKEFSTSGIEFTIEANPGTVDATKLKLLQQAGVNRLSFGVQSFAQQRLEFLGRRHKPADILAGYRLARELGFTNISFDLIFAIPGQSLSQWKQDLKQAVKLNPEHLSTYNLKIEPGTKFYKQLQAGKITEVEEEIDLQMYQYTRDYLAANGYQMYEISNFSKSGYNSQHNKIYWHSKPYLAFGPGAHFYDGVARGYNISSLQQYCNSLEKEELAWDSYNLLSKEEKIEEYMMMGLRLNEGISVLDFKKRFNNSIFSIYKTELDQLSQQGLINISDKKVKLSDKGLLLTNRVLTYFLLST